MSTDTVQTETISAEQLLWLTDRLADLQKRAKRLGVEAPSFDLVRSFTETVVIDRDLNIRAERQFHEVVLHDPIVRFDGWSFVALIDHTTGVVKTTGKAPEGTVAEYQAIEPLCDHCGRKMPRAKTIIIEHEDGTRKQVGSTCMKSFLTGFPSLSDSLFQFLDDRSWGEPSEFGMSRDSVDPMSFIAVANAVVRTLGWRSAAAESDSTRTVVEHLMFGKLTEDDRERYRHCTVRPDDYEAAASMIEWVRDREAKTDFDFNLRAAATASVIGKNAGLLAFLPEAFRRENEEAVERAKREEGPIADCPNGRTEVSGVVVAIKQVNSDYTYSGLAYKMTVRDERGFVVYGSVPRAFLGDRDFEVGSKVSFSGELTRSGDKPSFGFFSRPTKAVRL